MPETHHDSLRISYEVQGEGDPILLLPGTATDSSMWIPSAAAYLGGYRTIMVDPRDTPKSDQGGGPYTPGDLAGEALAVMDAEGVDKAHVAGYSLGGAAAQHLAVGAPDRIRSLMLICTWAASDAWLRHLFSWLADGAEAIGMEWANRAVLSLTLSAETHQSDSYESLLMFLNAWGQSSDELARQLRADAAHDASEKLGGIKIPTVVIGAGRDVFVPLRYQQLLAEIIPTARLEVFESAAHGLPLESPQELFSEMTGFLQDQ
ncbi:MAG: alpha/beta hydrolase [Actinobacteria bacterium]|nr:alpha/beta hydrolase [Actinomycetota bacterium]